MKRTIISASVLALAVAGVQAATAAPATYKVTGGGQVTEFLNTEGDVTSLSQGAGDTIAFSAQQEGTTERPDAAKGQFQYVDRVQDDAGKGTGKGQEVIHGTVSCVIVYSWPGSEEGGYAVIGGKSRDGEDFRIEVTDGSATGSGGDSITVRRGAAALDGSDDGADAALCDQETEADTFALGRGNVKIHKNGATTEEPSASEAAAPAKGKGKG